MTNFVRNNKSLDYVGIVYYFHFDTNKGNITGRRFGLFISYVLESLRGIREVLQFDQDRKNNYNGRKPLI